MKCSSSGIRPKCPGNAGDRLAGLLRPPNGPRPKHKVCHSPQRYFIEREVHRISTTISRSFRRKSVFDGCFSLWSESLRDRLRDRESCCLSQDETTFAEHVRRRCRHFFGDSCLRGVLRGSGKFYMVYRCICVVLSLMFGFFRCFAPIVQAICRSCAGKHLAADR